MKKITRKTIALLLIFVILSSFIPNLISNAANTPNLTMKVEGNTGTGTIEVTKGSTYTVNLELADGREDCRQIAGLVQYDQSILSLEDYGLKKVLLHNEDRGTAACISDTDGVTFTLTEEDGNKLKTSGKILELKFKVNAFCHDGTTIKLWGNKGTYTTDPEDPNGTEIDVPCNSIEFKTTGVMVPIENLTLTGDSSNIDLSTTTKTKQLTATILPNDTDDTDANKTVSWTSSNSEIASVDSTGLVTAKKAGNVTITASVTSSNTSVGINGVISKTFNITIVDPITGFTLNKSSATLDINKDETVTLTATKLPQTSPNELGTINWVSDNESVATVDSNGKVTPCSPGTANITASITGLEDKSCEITVIAPIDTISLSDTTVNLNKNATKTLTYTKSASKSATFTGSIVDGSEEWTSSNPTVATVNASTGLVTAITNGETDITLNVRNSYGTVITSNVCKVCVTVPLESIEIENPNINAGKIILKKGKTDNLTLKFNPDDYIGSKTVTWSSNDENKVTVVNGKITAINTTSGTLITATSDVDSTITASVLVEVPTVSATNIRINKNSTSIEKNETETLTAEITGDNVPSEEITDSKSITWTSSDENVATVDSNGIVTAKAPGNTTITATTETSDPSIIGGVITDTCVVTVTCALQRIELSETSKTIDLSDSNPANLTFTLTKTLYPSDTTVNPDELVWTSTNPTIASVNNGVVTALAPGETTIKASLAGKVAECRVKVEASLTGAEIENYNTPLDLVKKQKINMNVIYTPAYATIIPTPTWSSSDEDVATVDSNGKVTAKKAGTTVIEVDYGNGITSSRTVNVTEIPADGVVLDTVIETLNLRNSFKLEATLSPLTTTDDLVWELDPATVAAGLATIDNEGNLVAYKSGVITVKVYSQQNPNIFEEFNVTIQEVKLASVTSTPVKDTIEEGEKTTIKLKYNPEDVTDIIKNKYSSLTPAIATVDENGVITAKKAGKVTIKVETTATHEDGTKDIYESQFDLTITAKPIIAPAVKPDGTAAEPTGVNNEPAIVNTVQSLTTSPHTGDMNIIALGIMMIVSLAGMIIIIKKK